MAMENTAKKITIVSYILSGILWLLGMLTLLFNVLGLWAAWHLAGLGFIFYIPVPIIPAILFFQLFFLVFRKKRNLLL